MPEPHWTLVTAFLAAQALGVWLIAGAEHPPTPPELARFPDRIGEWSSAWESPTETEDRTNANADRLLSRFYVQARSGVAANLLIAWYQSQRAGDRQPHQPKVCLLGSGWIPVWERDLGLDTAAGTIRAKSYVVSRRRERAAILYWYQSPRRALSGEWAAKFWLALDAARDHRTDAALVRISVPVAGGGEDRAIGSTVAFARSVYPLLRAWLPR
jgi:EpsI family protein